MTPFGFVRAGAIALMGLAVVSVQPSLAQQSAANTQVGIPVPGQAANPPATGIPAPGPVGPPVLMIVDVEGILKDAKAAKGIQAQMSAQQQAYAKEFTKRRDDLRKQQDDLAKQQGVLPAETFDKKRKDFEQQVADFDKDAQERGRALDQSYTEALNQVKKGLIEIIQDLATEQRATLVLSKAQVILVDRRYEATDEALRRLDVKVPSVQVVFGNKPTADGAGAPAAAATPQTATAPKKKP